MKKQYCFLFLLFLALVSLPDAVPAQVTMDQFIGINTRAKDPIHRIRKFEIARDYHDWSLDVGFPTGNTLICPQYTPNVNDIRWNPSRDGATLYGFDSYYFRMRNKSLPTLKGLAPEMRGINLSSLGSGAFLLEQKPFCNGQTAETWGGGLQQSTSRLAPYP